MNDGANVEVQNDENQHGGCQTSTHAELDNQSLKAIMNLLYCHNLETKSACLQNPFAMD